MSVLKHDRFPCLVWERPERHPLRLELMMSEGGIETIEDGTTTEMAMTQA